jgi:hypothetical protein
LELLCAPTVFQRQSCRHLLDYKSWSSIMGVYAANGKDTERTDVLLYILDKAVAKISWMRLPNHPVTRIHLMKSSKLSFLISDSVGITWHKTLLSDHDGLGIGMQLSVSVMPVYSCKDTPFNNSERTSGYHDESIPARCEAWGCSLS